MEQLSTSRRQMLSGQTAFRAMVCSTCDTMALAREWIMREILEVLEDQDRPMEVSEIAEHLDHTPQRVMMILKWKAGNRVRVTEKKKVYDHSGKKDFYMVKMYESVH